MTSEKMDRRKKYSRMVLKKSLLQLLNEKQFSSVTVKEICEVADINRSTFYAHYADQYDLLEKIEAEIIDDMITYLNSYNFNEKDELLQMTETIIQYLSTKKEDVQILLNVRADSSFQLKVMDVAQRFITKKYMESNLIKKETSEYLSTFIVSGSVQVMKKWLNDGMEKSPKEMAILINNLINHGIYGFIH